MSSVRFAKAHSVTQCACRVNAMTVSTSATLGKKKVLRRKDKIDLVETITKGQLKKKMTKSKSNQFTSPLFDRLQILSCKLQ